MGVEQAFEKQTSNVPLTIKGEISRLLPDDHDGAHHQRFVVRIHNNHTVLVAHNLERAYRVDVKIADKIEVHGTYVWNKYGGILHNTHHGDRRECGKTTYGHIVCGPTHEDGWIIFAGQKDPHRKAPEKT